MAKIEKNFFAWIWLKFYKNQFEIWKKKKLCYGVEQLFLFDLSQTQLCRPSKRLRRLSLASKPTPRLVLKHVQCRSIWNNIFALLSLFGTKISLQTTFSLIHLWWTTVAIRLFTNSQTNGTLLYDISQIFVVCPVIIQKNAVVMIRISWHRRFRFFRVLEHCVNNTVTCLIY